MRAFESDEGINNEGCTKSPAPHQYLSDPEDVVDAINSVEISNYKLGVLLLIVLISTWIFGLEIINVVLKGDSYRKPWLLAVVTSSCFSLYLIPDAFYFFFPSKPPADLGDDGRIELTGFQVFSLAAQVALVYFLFCLFGLGSLQFTSASNQTALGSCGSMFTLILCVIVGVETFSVSKFVCVSVSIVGVFLVNFGESAEEGSSGSNAFLGNMMALLAALMYTTYFLLLRVNCGDEHKTNERRLFGYVGAICLICGIPLLILVHLLGLEKFELPTSNYVVFAILTNGVLAIISDYTSVLAMLLTSPLVSQLSFTSAIPITICIDFVTYYYSEDPEARQKDVSFAYVLGILLIFLSVILINLSISSENEHIEQVIHDSLEQAMSRDQTLSPVFSPVLLAGDKRSHHLLPQFRGKIGIHGSDLIRSLTPRPKLSHGPSHPDFDELNLNKSSDSESAPLFNPNHSHTLYTMDHTMDPTTDSAPHRDSRREYSVHQESGHRYRVKYRDSPVLATTEND